MARIELKIPLSFFRAAKLFVNPKEKRPYLRAVEIRHREVLALTATNGIAVFRAAITGQDSDIEADMKESPEATAICIPYAELVRICKLGDTDSTLDLIVIDGDATATVVIHGQATITTSITLDKESRRMFPNTTRALNLLLWKQEISNMDVGAGTPLGLPFLKAMAEARSILRLEKKPNLIVPKLHWSNSNPKVFAVVAEYQQRAVAIVALATMASEDM